MKNDRFNIFCIGFILGALVCAILVNYTIQKDKGLEPITSTIESMKSKPDTTKLVGADKKIAQLIEYYHEKGQE